MKWYIKVLQQYFDFNGRARRMEYWMFVLFNAIFGVAAMLLDRLVGLDWKEVGYGPIYVLYALAVFIPGLAVSIRRLHDIGKNGWFILLALIPLVGAIILIVFFCKDSDPGANEFGPNPKGESAQLLDSDL